MRSHTPAKDLVDDILDQWSEEQPELDMHALGVVVRVMTLNRRFADDAARALEPLGLELFEYDVLSALRRQGAPFSLPATLLARETELSSGAMTNRIDRLEERLAPLLESGDTDQANQARARLEEALRWYRRVSYRHPNSSWIFTANVGGRPSAVGE